MSSCSSMTISVLLIFTLLSTTFPTPTAQSCQSTTFSNNRLFALCQPLLRLGSTLHWTLNPTLGNVNIAYRAPQAPNGWIAWGLNPTGTGMIGTQALVALQGPDGAPQAFTVPIASRNPTMQNTPVSFSVDGLAAEIGGGFMTIFATITLPNNRTSFRHTWQASTLISAGVPVSHPTSGDNVLSTGTVDFSSGTTAAASGNTLLTRRNIHGVLNAISWGILIPMGAMIARYVRVFESADPAWFYLHIVCQLSGYILGVAGWGLGLKLGSESQGITHHRHRAIGITIFCLATLQVFALFLRPNKDQKYRKFWNVYHHSVGYMVIILGVVNIFKGFNILNPAKGWKNTYIAIIATLAGIAVVLEIATWIIVLRRKKSTSRGDNRQNKGGANGGV